jgi:hypothetical protein
VAGEQEAQRCPFDTCFSAALTFVEPATTVESTRMPIGDTAASMHSASTIVMP